MADVLCDWLSVSAPASHNAALGDVFAEFGDIAGAALQPSGARAIPGGGAFVYKSRRGWALLEASGGALAVLRGLGVYGEYLSRLGELPHRVTRLDAAMDVYEPAAPVLHPLAARGVSGSIHLGRKAIPGAHTCFISSAAAYPGEPLTTGTVYLPSLRHFADRQAVVYDKRQQQIEVYGRADPGPWTRYEARAGRKLGCTLSDAWEPAALFWEVMSPDVLPAPPDCPQRVPAGEGWAMGPVVPRGAYERLLGALGGGFGAELLRLCPDSHCWAAVVRFWEERKGSTTGVAA